MTRLPSERVLARAYPSHGVWRACYYKPTISGPEDITALVHVVEQPDSPVEILAIDFKDSWLSVAHERVTEQLRCTMKIRNRSDQQVKALSVSVIVGSSPSAGQGTGFEGFPGPAQTRSVAPGQEADIIGCGGGGSGGHLEIAFESSFMSAESPGLVASTYRRNGYPLELGIFVHNSQGKRASKPLGVDAKDRSANQTQTQSLVNSVVVNVNHAKRAISRLRGDPPEAHVRRV